MTRLSPPPRLLAAACVIAGAAMLMWAALANHRPGIFFDTEAYYLQGERVAESLHLLSPAQRLALAHEETPEQRAVNDTMLAARSPFYGGALYGAERIGGLWLAAWLQALAAAWTLLAFVRAAAPRAPRVAGLGVVALAAAGTALPFFASFLTPDVFAGLAALSVIALMVFRDRLGRAETVGFWLMLLAALLFHQSTLLAAILIAAAGALTLLAFKVPRPELLKRLSLVGSTILLAMVLGQGWLLAHKVSTGETLRRPPFLMARLMADGTGRRYLRAVCTGPAEPYAACRFMDLPLDDTEQILWAEDPRVGVMNASDHDTRVRLEQEEFRFALGVLAHDPLGQMGASLGNLAAQLRMTAVQEPLRDPTMYFGANYYARTSLPRIIPGGVECRGPGGCPARVPADAVGLVHRAVLLLTMGFLGWRLTRRDGLRALEAADAKGTDMQRLAMVLLLVLAAVVANAAVCAVLSGPFPRYGARMIWLLPVYAGIVAAVLGLSIKPLVPAKAGRWIPI